MNQDHLSREQLERYRDRLLPASDLPAADAHLSQCAECRTTLAGLTPAGPAAALLADIAGAASEHLTQEQMDDWFEARMDQTGRELVTAHIGICDSCAEQLRAYEASAAAMSAPIPKVRAAQPAGPAHYKHAGAPARPAPSFGERIKTLFQSPQLILMLAAGIVLVIGAPYLALRTLPGGGGQAGVDGVKDVPLDTSAVDALPQALAISAQEVLAAQQPELPEVLADVPTPLGFEQTYPVSEVVEATRPTFTWQQAEPPPYTVLIRNAAGQAVLRVPGIMTPLLVVPMELERGAVYTWQLTFPSGSAEEASFKVMDEGDLALWQQARADYRDSHLVLGLLAQHFGLLSIAQSELQEVVAANPNSEQAAVLLDNVIALRE